MDGLLGHGFRDRHDVQAQLRLTAHGVDIRKGIGRGDLPEEVRVVCNGREKIHRLHQGQVVTDLVHRRVIALVKAHQQVGVLMDPDAVQQLSQHARAHLGAASGALGQLCQLHFIFRHTVVLSAASAVTVSPARR